MTYFDGFVLAVPAANKDAYLALAEKVAPAFMEFGATRLVEAWGEYVPDGALTDFKRAVKATEDEAIVFSWIEYPDRAARDAAHEKMKEMTPEDMPFDGKRMIFGGFATILDEGPRGPLGYVDGMLTPVRNERDDYRAACAAAASALLEHGASRVVHGWGDDTPDGKVTDYRRAVLAEDGETVVYAWIEWPSPDVREAAWKTVMADPRMKTLPFDGRRAVFGAFAPILDA